MSTDLQIIYVTLSSIIVFAEDIHCVTSIKLCPLRKPSSAFLFTPLPPHQAETAEPSAPRQTCIWPSFVQHFTQCEGFFYLKCQPAWQMMYVFLQACDYQHRDAVQCSSPHQFHKLHSKVCEAFAARWLLTCSQAGAFCCEYLTPDFLPIRVSF